MQQWKIWRNYTSHGVVFCKGRKCNCTLEQTIFTFKDPGFHSKDVKSCWRLPGEVSLCLISKINICLEPKNWKKVELPIRICVGCIWVWKSEAGNSIYTYGLASCWWRRRWRWSKSCFWAWKRWCSSHRQRLLLCHWARWHSWADMAKRWVIPRDQKSKITVSLKVIFWKGELAKLESVTIA